MNIFFGAVFVFSIILDQITKKWALSILKNSSSMKIIDDFLRFSYVENRGAAFGILQNQIIFFVIITIVMIIAL